MSSPPKSDLDFERWEQQSGAEAGMHGVVAPAKLVNRTHRIVRERAVSMKKRRSTVRSLWIPLTISGGLLSLFCFAIWSIFESNDSLSNGAPDSTGQMFVFLMWCLPVSAAVLAVVWYRKNTHTRDEGAR